MLLSAFSQYNNILQPLWINPAAVEAAGCCMLSFHQGLLLDKQIPAPSLFYGEAVQYTLISLSLSSLQSLPAACIGFGLYQSSYWSQMKHWTHQYGLNASLLFNHLPFKSPGSSPTSHPFSVICCTSHQFALSFWEEYAIIINISQHSLCQPHSALWSCLWDFRSLPPPHFFYLFCCLLSRVENRCFSLTTNTYDGLFLHLKWGFMNVTNEVKVQPHWLGW